MIAHVSYGSCPMCEMPQVVEMAYSNFRPLGNLRDYHVYLNLLEETNINIPHSLHVHPICNQFWQFPLCNVYQRWQACEMHQLLMGLVQDLLHCLFHYLKARNVKDQFDNGFTSEAQFPSLQCFPKPLDSMTSSSWKGEVIQGLIRTLAVNCTQILDCSMDARTSLVATASD